MDAATNRSHHGWMLFWLGALTWAVAIGGHELIGHGGVCAIDPGCQWRYADAMYFDGTRTEGSWMYLQKAMGSVYNIALALAAAAWLWLRPPPGPALRIFLWLLVVINLFQAGSYIAFGQFIHEGMDWVQLAPLVPGGGTTMLALGLVTVSLGAWLGWILFPATPSMMPLRASTRFKTFGLPYLACAATAIGASLLVPSDDRFFMLMGGIGGSVSFLIWMPVMAAIPRPRTLRRPMSAALPFDGIVLGVAIVVAGAYVFVLGPGVEFG